MNEYLNLLDLASHRFSDPVVGLIEENLQFAPEFQTLPVRTKTGTSYKITLREEFPAVQFRDVNEGVETSKSRYVQRMVEMFFLDGQMEVDEAVIRGDDSPLGSLLALEASGVTKQSFITLGSQIYYGRSADAKGFFGYGTQVDSSMVVDATGSGNNTTSAWFVWENLQGAHLIVGADGQISLGDWTKQRITRDSKQLMAFVNNLSGYVGLSVGSKYSIGRIKNITSLKPLTDSLGADMIAKFPVGMKPTRCYMNRQAALFLQKSRSAVGQVAATGTGAPGFAPYPTEIQGVPITVTDSITSTEVAS